MVKSGHIRMENVVFLILSLIVATVRSEGNIALARTATQSSNGLPNLWLAGAAVDGCQTTDIGSNCCTYTASNGPKTVWWRVDLGQISTIDSIQIIYRDNYQERFAGYQLYVSNTTNSPQDGVLCYEDTSSILAAVQLNVIHQCPYVGRYVTVYNYRSNLKRYSWYSDYAVLELCEVLVYGCPVGRYGNGDCSQVCPATCYGGNCNPKTGSCLYCTPTTYGIVCENTCSSDCKDSLCDRYSGFCLDCVDGKYGATCDMDCSGNCKDPICDRNTGYCSECVTGKFGNICEQDCSVNCKDRLCVKDSGNCTECSIGKYGSSCDQDCPGYCRDGCTRDNASCIGCATGRYGVACTSTCPVTCKDFVCGQQTGQCLDCYPGKYGVVCGADCPVSCPDNICNKEDGQCLTQGMYMC
ncbi:scavenger receptor class F member 1-like [Argopecten irradians]|uniref:scavenger receptor class F member 1-like n=1 Tax=Argopecten irradians TaxID=31199 RepID=UPI003717D399